MLGLEIGGDDYVTKPFSPRELVARVKAILKRSGSEAGPDRRHAALVAGELSLDRRGRTVTLGESAIAMTALEFAILDALLSHRDMVFSREQLMEAAYGPNTYCLLYTSPSPRD